MTLAFQSHLFEKLSDHLVDLGKSDAPLLVKLLMLLESPAAPRQPRKITGQRLREIRREIIQVVTRRQLRRQLAGPVSDLARLALIRSARRG